MSRYDQGSAMPAGEGVPAEGIVKWFNGVKGFGFVAINNDTTDAFLHVSVVNRAGMQSLNEHTRIKCLVAPSQRGMQVTHIIEVLGIDENAAAQGSSDRGGNRGGDRGDRNDRGGRGGDRGGDRGDRGGYGGRDDYQGGGRNQDRGQDRGYGGRDDYSGGYGQDRGDRGGYGQEREARPQPTGPETEVVGTVKWYKPDKGFGFAVPDDGGKDVFIHRSALGRVGMDSIEPGRKIRMMVVNSSKGREASSLDVVD